MKPTAEQIKRVKYSNAYTACYVTKPGVETVITEWERIRGRDPDMISKKAAEEQKAWSYWEGFEEALSLLEIPECPFCGTKMKAGYACGESFITPVGYKEGAGCPKCRTVPMHGNIRQVLQDWKDIRRR